MALDLTNKLLQIFPTHSRALGNKIYYEKEIEKNNVVKRKGDDESADINVNEQVTKINFNRKLSSLMYNFSCCTLEIIFPNENYTNHCVEGKLTHP